MNTDAECLPGVDWFLNCSATIFPSTSTSTTECENVEETPSTTSASRRNTKLLKKTHASSTASVMMTPPSTPESHVDYKNVMVKPPFSYAQLITQCIESANGRKVLLSDIYSFIRTNYAYYRISDCTWKNSIRHNLSLNKQFVKLPREEGDRGKGSYWQLASQLPPAENVRKCHPSRASHSLNHLNPKINPAAVTYLDQAMTNSSIARKRSFQGLPIDNPKKSCPSEPTVSPSPFPECTTPQSVNSETTSTVTRLPEIVLSFADMDFGNQVQGTAYSNVNGNVSERVPLPQYASLPQQDPHHLQVDMTAIANEHWNPEANKDELIESSFQFTEAFDLLNEMEIDVDSIMMTTHPWTDNSLGSDQDEYLELCSGQMYNNQ